MLFNIGPNTFIYHSDILCIGREGRTENKYIAKEEIKYKLIGSRGWLRAYRHFKVFDYEIIKHAMENKHWYLVDEMIKDEHEEEDEEAYGLLSMFASQTTNRYNKSRLNIYSYAAIDNNISLFKDTFDPRIMGWYDKENLYKEALSNGSAKILQFLDKECDIEIEGDIQVDNLPMLRYALNKNISVDILFDDLNLIKYIVGKGFAYSKENIAYYLRNDKIDIVHYLTSKNKVKKGERMVKSFAIKVMLEKL